MFTSTFNRVAVVSAAGCVLSPTAFAVRVVADQPAAGTTSDAQLTLQGPRDSVYSVAFDADGGRVASASKDGLVKVWDAQSGQEAAICKGHEAAALRLAFSPDGKTLASAGQDKTVRLWDPATGKQLRKLQGHENYVAGVAFSPD